MRIYSIKRKDLVDRSLCAICKSALDLRDRTYAVYIGDTGLMCLGCARVHAPELARAADHLTATPAPDGENEEAHAH